MSALELPALRSDDTLGFLAALGLLELCQHGLHVDARLGWDGLGGPARLDVPFSDPGALGDALATLALDWRQHERLTPTELPVIRQPLGTQARRQLEDAGALDPMRLAADEAVRRFASQQSAELVRATATDASWLCALVGQLSPAKRGEPDRRLTPLYSPSGQMTLFQLYRDARDEVCKRPGVLTEAIAEWRRYPGTGANLDSRALIDAAEATGGKPANRAVPGATWLALQALPFFLQTGDGSRGEIAAWPRDGRRGGLVLRWPVWSQLLDAAAVRVLLAHPVIDEIVRTLRQGIGMPTTSGWGGVEREAQALGVCAVLTARRKPLAKSAGPLQPPDVLWSRAT